MFLVVEWPDEGVPETRTGLDAAQIMAAARRVVEIWPDLQPPAPHSGRTVGNEPGPYGTGPGGFDPYDYDTSGQFVGVMAVPGGCVLSRPMSYLPGTPEILSRLSAGTVACGMFFNPKGGTYGHVIRDGRIESDDEIGRDPGLDAPPGHWLFRFWQWGEGAPYGAREIAFLAATAGTRPENAGPLTGPPRRWVKVSRSNR
jgi:hypothetical protein